LDEISRDKPAQKDLPNPDHPRILVIDFSPGRPFQGGISRIMPFHRNGTSQLGGMLLHRPEG
jgi:hypothetical protein